MTNLKLALRDIRDPNCGLCPLAQTADVVCQMGKGPADAEVMVVSKMTNSPQYQNALEEELTRLGLDVGSVYFTQAIRCKTFERDATRKNIKDCANAYMEPEVQLIKPKYILVLGNEALMAVTGKSGITKYRGRVIDRPDGIQVIGTISPSAVNRNPGQKPAYQADLRLFVNLVKGRKVGIEPPTYEVIDSKLKLMKLKQQLMRTHELEFDIETVDTYYEPGARIVSIAGVCEIREGGETELWVFALPLSHAGSVWKSSWKKVLNYLKDGFLAPPKVVAHNSSYDCKWMHFFGIPIMPTFDTMLAIHVLDENVQKGLKPQAMARLGVAPWGIDTLALDKQKMVDILEYNVLDVWYMYWVKKQLVEELKKDTRAARILMREIMPAQRELILSELRGVWIDVKRLNERKPQAEARLADIEQRIRATAGLKRSADEDLGLLEEPGMNYIWPGHPQWPAKVQVRQLKSGIREKVIPLEENFNASQFARWLLFEHLDLPILERGKEKPDGSEGDPSMKEDVLLALKDHHPAVEHMLDRVTAQKHLSSFFNPYSELYDENHRIHTTFKLAGTVTGRLSSGKDDPDKITGSKGKRKGVNLQQVPRDPFIRGLFGAPPGWTFVEADYSQIELRIAAYLANEETMKHLYSIGADIHTTTAARVAGLPESQVEKEVRKKLGKPVNFGFLYGMGWRKFIQTAFSNYGAVFTEDEAQGARNTFFELYPQLLPWHARQRRLVNKYGRVQSPLGRVRHLPDIYSPDKGVRMEAERQAINSPVQGFASDLAVLAMIEINHEFRRRGLEAYCLGLVHDAINYEIRNDHLAEALPIIKDMMEDMSIVERKFGVHVDIPIVSDVSVGQHWGDKKELTPEQVYDFKMEYKGE